MRKLLWDGYHSMLSTADPETNMLGSRIGGKFHPPEIAVDGAVDGFPLGDIATFARGPNHVANVVVG